MMGRVDMNGASGGSILGKMMVAGCAMIMAGPVVADVVTCEMSDGGTLEFIIDRNQFVDAIDVNEPPRRKATSVRYGDKQFPAEPILLGEMRGFHADGLGGSTLLFVVQPDGAARLTNQKQGLRRDGFCEVVN